MTLRPLSQESTKPYRTPRRWEQCISEDSELSRRERKLLESINRPEKVDLRGELKLRPEEASFIFRYANYEHRQRLALSAKRPTWKVPHSSPTRRDNADKQHESLSPSQPATAASREPVPQAPKIAGLEPHPPITVQSFVSRDADPGAGNNQSRNLRRHGTRHPATTHRFMNLGKVVGAASTQ